MAKIDYEKLAAEIIGKVGGTAVSYTHLREHETLRNIGWR